MEDLTQLRDALRQFATERNWAQFHTPKNLAMALCGEAAELMEPFQWLTVEQSRELTDKQREAVAQEIGDVLIYLTMLADKLGLDPLTCAHEKMALNARKYPVDVAYGSAQKRGLPADEGGG
ncbi:nucleotide pyrophosphohydrolase [Magnetofaba australis]|uniref:Putative MazG nucleotide pyrophosphohydrolase domain-containing protein n=1 Tax=Magnetofaba australis IT-1 TaxID=1434232 RepID=A0A1Y2JYX8_9PROT|nr:nucleotide pyrophosphohydrolase [Magnetofaba australis]OSM00098.1 putative MazG nucleotide pyrophosphohydrolase domain-containing protein [Magnetofaba australis IT-1]